MMRFKVRGALAFTFVAAMTAIACSGGPGEESDSTSGASSSGHVNLCVNQVANSFHCLDDTRFELCTGGGNFVVESCPAHLCATRHPAIENPCIGAARAQQIDGVPPTPPGEVDNGGGAASGGATQTGGNTGSTGAAGNTGNTGNAGNTGNTGNTGSTGTASGGQAASGGNGTTCVGGPKFDPAGEKNVGNGHGQQFIGGQCLSAADCASGCCAKPCGICSGPGAQFQAGKQGCGF